MCAFLLAQDVHSLALVAPWRTIPFTRTASPYSIFECLDELEPDSVQEGANRLARLAGSFSARVRQVARPRISCSARARQVGPRGNVGCGKSGKPGKSSTHPVQHVRVSLFVNPKTNGARQVPPEQMDQGIVPGLGKPRGMEENRRAKRAGSFW
eukprot:gene12496-biopygen9491